MCYYCVRLVKPRNSLPISISCVYLLQYMVPNGIFFKYYRYGLVYLIKTLSLFTFFLNNLGYVALSKLKKKNSIVFEVLFKNVFAANKTIYG